MDIDFEDPPEAPELPPERPVLVDSCPGYRKVGPALHGARHMDHGVLVAGTIVLGDYPLDGESWLPVSKDEIPGAPGK